MPFIVKVEKTRFEFTHINRDYYRRWTLRFLRGPILGDRKKDNNCARSFTTGYPSHEEYPAKPTGQDLIDLINNIIIPFGRKKLTRSQENEAMTSITIFDFNLPE